MKDPISSPHVPTYRITQPLDHELLQHGGPNTDFTVLERTDLILESPSIIKDSNENQAANRPARVLGTFSVVAITFLYACGGPLGSEPIVSTAGPFVGLPGLLIYPVVYTIPYASVVMELSAAFPADGGFTIWILNAFGPFWAVQVGYWSWVSAALSIAIYPSYILDTIARVTDFHPSHAYFLKVAIALALTAPVLLGTKCVSRLACSLLVAVWLPLLIFVVWGLVETDAAASRVFGDVRRANTTLDAVSGAVTLSGDVSIDWNELLNTLYWNYEGLRMASVFGGQVRTPSVVYKRAIWFVVALTVAAYALPLVATLASGAAPWPSFDRGTYEAAALALGGTRLRVAMVASSFATCVGLLVCGVFCSSTEISGMAENKLLPDVLAARNAACGSPHAAVAATLAGVLALMALDADELLPVANAFGSLAAASVFLAAVELRRTQPLALRPVRVAGGVAALAALSLAPVALCAFICARAVGDAPLLALGVGAPAAVVGALQAFRFRRRLYR